MWTVSLSSPVWNHSCATNLPRKWGTIRLLLRRRGQNGRLPVISARTGADPGRSQWTVQPGRIAHLQRPPAQRSDHAPVKNPADLGLRTQLLLLRLPRRSRFSDARPSPRTRWAKTYMKMYRSGIAKGIFLSSGVAGGGMRTQDRLIDTAEVLRNKLSYTGYLHLKIMPGAERDQVERAMQLADRVSINLEAPTTERLSRLAPQKIFLDELLAPLRWIDEIRRTKPAHFGWNGHWPSSVTQFVAGGSGETDLELLRTSAYLHHRLHLARVYFPVFPRSPEPRWKGSRRLTPGGPTVYIRQTPAA